MPNALTPAQFEIMRRVRDIGTLLAGDPVANMTRELGFLFAVELLTYDASGMLTLSDLGAAYLGAAEEEAARAGTSLTASGPDRDAGAGDQLPNAAGRAACRTFGTKETR